MKKILLIFALFLPSLAHGQVVINSGVKIGNGSTGGVSSINTVQGAFTFTGSGVSCSTTTCTFSGGSGSMTWPATAGVANYAGSNAWGTSYQVGTAANDLVQLNSSGYLPALNASLLTGYPYASLTGTPTIPTVGTWGALNYPAWVSGTPFIKMTAAGTFALDTNVYLTGITSSQVTTALGFTPYNSTNPSGYITNTVVTLPDLALPYSQLTGTPTIPTSADWPNAGACTTNEWVTALNNGAVSTCLQPAFSNLSGTATAAQIPGTLNATTVPNLTDTALTTSGDCVLVGTGGLLTEGSCTSGGVNATSLQGVAISSTAPTSGQVLGYNGTDWIPTTGSGTGTVTSVAMTVPSDESVSGSPITTNGTLAVTRNSEAANLFLASPSGAAGIPAYRALVALDIPAALANTTSVNGTTIPASATLMTTTSTYSGTLTLSQITTALAYTPANCTAGTSGSDCLQLASGLVPTANVPDVNLPTPGTAIALTGPSGFAVCTAACTVTLPIPAPGMQFCAYNDDAVATVITIAAISGVYFEKTARTAYEAVDTAMTSGGAVGDAICMVGRDATHYLTVSYTGTWTP